MERSTHGTDRRLERRLEHAAGFGGRARSDTSAVLSLVEQARHGVTEAAFELRPGDRYALAHLAALRAAAAVLAARAQPTRAPASTQATSRTAKRVRRAGPRSAWALLAEVSPALGEWAEFFAGGAGKRAAAEAGLDVVCAREADDLLRDTETFLGEVETLLGLPHQSGLPLDRRAG